MGLTPVFGRFGLDNRAVYLILHIILLITRYVERLEPEREWEESVRQRKWFPKRLNGFLKKKSVLLYFDGSIDNTPTVLHMN